MDPASETALERVRFMESSKFWKLRNALFALRRRLRPGAPPPTPPFAEDRRAAEVGEYGRWILSNEPSDAVRDELAELARRIPGLPRVSIVMPVHDPSEAHLRAAIASVTAQCYPAWELCIADDGSRRDHVAAILAEWAHDPRVRMVRRETAGGIVAATADAVALATGEWVTFLDHDDELAPDALLTVMIAALDDGEIDMLYTDEDKIDDAGVRFDPFFKPDWSPYTLLSRNYVAHLAVYRRSLVEAAGGIRAGFDGAQDYDLALRVSERARAVRHVPRILYHWRSHAGSTAGTAGQKSYAYDAGLRAIASALERRGIAAAVRPGPPPPGGYTIDPSPREARVAVIVPTRDNAEDLERCAAAVFAQRGRVRPTLYIVDNGSREPAARAAIARLDERADVVVIACDEPFNFSRLNNLAAARSTEPLLLLLNDDVILTAPDALDRLGGFLTFPDVAVAGARLLYPDGTLQHAGVVTGIGGGNRPGIAGHPHKGEPGSAHGYFRRADALTEVSAVTAACLMVRRDAFERVGGLDEDLAVAFNDVDFCLRLRREGYRILYVPEVVGIHHESKTRGSDDTAATRPRFLEEVAFMQRRWGTTLLQDPYWSPHLSLATESVRIRIS